MCWQWMSDKYRWSLINFIGSILVLGELSVKFQDFIALSVYTSLHFVVCYWLILHLGSNSIATYFGVVFLCGCLRNKIILGTVRHTHLCSCRLWVAWPLKHTETEVCRQFTRAVILVLVGFGLQFTTTIYRFSCFLFHMSTLCQRVGRLSRDGADAIYMQYLSKRCITSQIS